MIDDAFGHWLAGFIDGEGCFRIHSQKRGRYLTPAFHLKLRADDRPILEEIARRVGAGRLYDMPAHGTSRPGTVWRCQSQADCRALAAVLDRYPLRAKKAREYAVWREALDHHAATTIGTRWRPRDNSTMAEFKRRIEELRDFDRNMRERNQP